MYKIGITGSIGTGKTSVAKVFALFGIPIFDADREVRKLLSDEDVKRRLKIIWPDITKNGHLNKLKLKTIIFNDNKEKKKLERLLYPYLQVERDKFDDANYNKQMVAYDIPLIYETKSEGNYDLILLTNCEPELQRKRVLNRDKISNSLYKKIISSQLSFEEKIKFNPKIINTSNSKIFIYIKIVLLITKISIKLKINKWKK